MSRKAVISFFIILTFTILTVFPVNPITREDYTHTLTWTNDMSFEGELTIRGIYIAMGGTRIVDYDVDLGTGILVVSCCNIIFNETLLWAYYEQN